MMTATNRKLAENRAIREKIHSKISDQPKTIEQIAAEVGLDRDTTAKFVGHMVRLKVLSSIDAGRDQHSNKIKAYMLFNGDVPEPDYTDYTRELASIFGYPSRVNRAGRTVELTDTVIRHSHMCGALRGGTDFALYPNCG